MRGEGTSRIQNRAGGEKSPVIWTIVGILLGAVLLYASTRQVDAEELVTTLRSIELQWAVCIVGCTAAFGALKASRWGLLLSFVDRLAFSRVHAAVYAGLALNFLVSHTGEFFRAGMIARSNEVSATEVFASVVVERALDFVALLALLALMAMLASEVPTFVTAASWFAGGVVLAAVAGLFMILNTPQWVSRFLTLLTAPFPAGFKGWCIRQVGLTRAGLSAMRNPRMMALAVILSLLQWCLVVLAIWCSARSLGISAPVEATMATFVLIVLGLMLPNSPMQLGTTQLAFAVGLGTGGVAATSAVAASVVYTLFLIVPIMLVGAACLIQGWPRAGVRPC